MKWHRDIPQDKPELTIEQRVFGKASGLPQRIACHVYNNRSKEKVIIMSPRPRYLMSNVRKQWLKIIRQLQREYAGTLSVNRKVALAEELKRIEALQFVAKNPSEVPSAQVYFVKQAEV